MKKCMYSLILNEDVVNEIDRLAYERGTNRSNLINGILAEYCRMVTPEMHIKNIFDQIFSMFEGTQFLPAKVPNSGIMAIKTSLDYKYHPTVKYEVQLLHGRGRAEGNLRVGLRTQNSELLRVLADFFNKLSVCEAKYSPRENYEPFVFDGAKFVKPLDLGELGEADVTDVAATINAYVRVINDMLNSYFAGKYSCDEEFEKDYLNHISAMPIII